VRHIIRAHKTVAAAIALGVLLLSWFAWDYSASARGSMVARYDVARGHYRVLHYGFPSPGLAKYARIMRQRYGIEYLAVAGCVLSPSLKAYADGYNAVSMAAVKRKYGRDIFLEP